MTRLISAEFLKLRTTQVWIWLLLATCAVSGLLVTGQLASNDQVTGPSDVPDLFTSAGTAYIVVFVLGVLGVTTEFRYQTITPTVLITPSRWAIITAKMITYAILGVLYALAATIVELAVALPWLSHKNIDVDFGDGNVQHAIVGVFGVVALFGIVGLGVGALLRNQVVAVVVGIIFLLVIQQLLAVIPGVRHIYPYTPGGAVAAIFTITGDRVSDGVHLLSSLGGVIALLFWAFVPAVLGARFTLARDIT